MTNDKQAAFQALLDGLRNDFLSQLSERCDSMEALILRLSREPSDREVFNALYRAIHSLKGAGGTHGMPVITTVCHQLENMLCEADARQGFDGGFTVHALAFVDLLRETEKIARQLAPDYSAIEIAMQAMRKQTLQQRKSVMIADTSPVMTELYRHLLATLPVHITAAEAGMPALERLMYEPFDLAIIGREMKNLNGVALVKALRESSSLNRDISVVLITTNLDGIPSDLGMNVIRRGTTLPEQIQATVVSLLGIG